MNSQPTQQSHFLEISAPRLEPGMYVAALDRPWLDTPFAVQGFYVFTREDIDFVAQHCANVYVDPRRRTKTNAKANVPRPRRTHKDQTSLKNELTSAKVDLASASDIMSKVFTRLNAGKRLDIGLMQTAIRPLIQSVLRNGEAMAALVRMKQRGEYLFNHSLAVAVWAAVLGRHLGLSQTRLEQLALGAALLDIGMVGIEDDFLQSTEPLDAPGLAQIQKHVPLAIDLLKNQQDDLAPQIVEMVATHHERHDGSGYPSGLKGVDIPLFGRIAGLIDSYEAMTTSRPYARCRSSFEAMQELADLKDSLFQGSLVEQFMQAVGLFPTGSVVQFNNGEVGVIVKQNVARRLRPKVIMILDAHGKPHDTLIQIDLANYTPEAGGSDLWISRELEPGAHGIHPDEYFL